MGPIFEGFILAGSVRVPGDPRGKGSVRVISIKTAKGSRKKGIQEPKSRKYEMLVASLARAQRPRKKGLLFPLDGPLILRALAVIKRPKKLPWSIPIDPSDPNSRMLCPATPDWDNLAKSYGDGLKKGGMIYEDRRIVDGRVVTVYARPGESPYSEIYIFAHRVTIATK